MIELRMDYGLDPCMVKRIGWRVVTSCPCIGDIKVLQTLFSLSFDSVVLAGLRATVHGFHGGHGNYTMHPAGQRELRRKMIKQIGFARLLYHQCMDRR